MKKVVTAGLSLAVVATASMAGSLNDNPNYKKLKNFKPDSTANNQTCLMCHKGTDSGIVADWKHSKHAQVGVGCVECHVVPKNYPTAYKKHPFQGGNWTVQIAVSSVTCAKCHAKEVTEYLNSGHARGGVQWLATPKNKHGYLMTKLSYHYESLKGDNPSYEVDGKKMGSGIRTDSSFFKANQNNSRLADTNVANICIQCHGTVIKLD